MTNLKQIEDDLAELAEIRKRLKVTEKELAEARAEVGILTRRLDISERKRVTSGQTIGELVGAMNSWQLMLNHLFLTLREQGYKPADVEPTIPHSAVAPKDGGGKVDPGEPIPAFLQEFQTALNGGTKQ